jgi:hypothetical protein
MLFGWSPRAGRQAFLACHCYAPLPLGLNRPVQHHTPRCFTLRDSQKYEGVGQASSRLAVVSRAGAGAGWTRFTPASDYSTSTVHVSLSIAASTPHPWRRRGCLHEEKISGMGLLKYNAYIRWESCTRVIPRVHSQRRHSRERGQECFDDRSRSPSGRLRSWDLSQGTHTVQLTHTTKESMMRRLWARREAAE